MSFPSNFFKGLLKTLAGQLFDQNQDHAECIGEDFGSHISANAKTFFAISVIEEKLPLDLAAIGVLVDNRASDYKLNRIGYTFFIYIDPSRKFEEKAIDDITTIIGKMILSHEASHFAFYYELFFQLGDDLTSTLYTQFQSKISEKLKNAISSENDNTKETVVEEHKYEEFIENFCNYPNSHYDKNGHTKHDYSKSNKIFIKYLNE